MVQMMESQCEYFMYFPAVPITDLSDPARYRTLPRRSHLYLGETVRFLLVLRCRDAAATPPEPGHGNGRGGAQMSCAVFTQQPWFLWICSPDQVFWVSDSNNKDGDPEKIRMSNYCFGPGANINILLVQSLFCSDNKQNKTTLEVRFHFSVSKGSVFSPSWTTGTAETRRRPGLNGKQDYK